MTGVQTNRKVLHILQSPEISSHFLRQQFNHVSTDGQEVSKGLVSFLSVLVTVGHQPGVDVQRPL